MKQNPTDMRWETLSSEYLFREPWLTVRRDAVRLPNGTVHPDYYVLEYPTWINVIAITPEGDFVMVEQYRHARAVQEIELCAGVVEDGEDPLEGAKRELLEETGFGGGEWTLNTVVAPNPGSQNNLSYCYIARGVTRIGTQHLDATEDIRVHILTPRQVYDLVASGALSQAIMQATLWKFFALYGIPE